MKFFNTILFVSIFFYSFQAKSTNLEYEIKGVSGDIETNVRAHLGPLPETDIERSNFLFNVKKNTLKALQAYSYFNAKVSTKLNKRTSPWQLEISVKANKQTHLNKVNIQLLGEAKSEESFKQITDNHNLQAGGPLVQTEYENLKSDLFNEGLELGYFDGQLTSQRIAINRKKSTADIDLVYDSGNRYTFGKVNFSDIDLSPRIMSMLNPIVSGEPYKAETLLQLQNQMQQSKYFSAIAIRPDRENAANNAMPINVNFQPVKSHFFDIGLGYATDTKERVSFGWKMPKINRHGHRMETKLSYSKINPNGKIIYQVPLTHPYKDVMQIGLRLEDDKFGDIKSNQQELQIARIRNVEGWIRSSYIRYLKEDWRTASEQINASFYLPGFSWSRTTKSGSAIDPDAGFSQIYTVEATDPAIGSDIRILHLEAKWKWVHRYNQHHRFVLKGQAGLSQVDDEDVKFLPPSLRFFAGGDQSIRGFAYQSLGPEEERKAIDGTLYDAVVGGSRIATASAEYQYYFNKSWRSPLFIDIGHAFNKEKLNPVYSIGSGVHYMSPIGPIKLEAAYGISEDDPPWRIHFSMGAEL